MKVLSIIQPWATLLALREKQYETRHWQTRYRGPIAIHASRKTDEAITICRWPIYAELLDLVGYDDPHLLPFGSIIAVADLIAVHPATPAFRSHLSSVEQSLGDFTNGRYAWEFRNMRHLAEPIPARGKPGIWEIDDALIVKAAR